MIPSQSEVRSRYDAHIAATPNPAAFTFIDDPDHPDFWSFNNACSLGKIGVFAIDRPKHRAKREREARERLLLEADYWALGLDREREHERLAAALEGTLTNGVWAKSTGRYAAATAAADHKVTQFASLHEGGGYPEGSLERLARVFLDAIYNELRA